MAIKQTQTKLFDFSDAGLDFCAGSKALFPDRFKKMLALGYNVQTVTNVAIVGDQVKLTYGGVHGYVADRVLKVDSGDLSLINNGEFYIDSVTINTVTLTIEGASASVASGFTTRIAPLGWSLEYESGQVHLYKMKYLDERDLYVRLVFANTGAVRSTINVCVGKTANISTGVITDPKALSINRDSPSVQAGFEWMFNNGAVATFDNYTYSQGLSIFGKGCVVGSKYHVVFLSNINTATYSGRVMGIVPCHTFNYEELDYPLVLGQYSTTPLTSTATADLYQLSNVTANSGASSNAYIGNIPVALEHSSNVNTFITVPSGRVLSSFIPEGIDSFNTTAAIPLYITEKTTKQFVGMGCGGLYRTDYLAGSTPPNTRATSPSESADVDLISKVKVHFCCENGSANSFVYFAVPVEEIKIVS